VEPLEFTSSGVRVPPGRDHPSSKKAFFDFLRDYIILLIGSFSTFLDRGVGIMTAEKIRRPLRVLVAKPGLDGHDRGAKVVAHALRDAGMEVIYTGLHQSVESIVQAAMQEDVDVIGLSIMSGAHLPICKKLVGHLKEKNLQDKLVVVGGVIPKKDIPTLKELGAAGVFPGGTPFSVPIEFIRQQTTR
jgi:methylmalonyl-CoA mutase C-terminal domain/subunit